MNKASICCFLLLCCLIGLNAQSEEIDSLMHVVKLQEDNEEKVDNLVKIAYEYTRIDIELSSEYAQQALDISDDLKYKKGQASGLWLLALTGYYKGNYDVALDYGNKSLVIAESINDPLTILRTANTISAIYGLKAKHDASIEYLLYAYKASVQLDDSLMMLQLLQNLGFLHRKENNISEAKKHYKKLSTFEVHPSSSPTYITYLNYGTGVYHFINDEHEEAIQFYKKAIPLATSEGNLFALAILHEGIGESYYELDSYTRAEFHFKEALANYETIGTTEHKVQILSLIHI